MFLPLLQLVLLVGWFLGPVMATNRIGRNGERFRPGKPSGSGRRTDERARHPEAVQRLVLDIRTDDLGRSRKRSRRNRRRSSSSESSSSSRNKKKDKQEIARLKALLAEKEAEESKRMAAQKLADAETARKREMEDFKASVLALLPKQPSQVLPPSETGVEQKAAFTAEVAQRAGYFVHEVADFTGCASWDDVETRLKDVSNTKLKEMLQRKGVAEVPSSKPAVIKAAMRSLRAEFPRVQ